MKTYLRAVVLLGLLLTATVPALAQDEDSPELAVYVVPREMTIYELTQQLNICFEDLQPTFEIGWRIYGYDTGIIPPDIRVTYELGHGPCYDTEGNRIGYNDRTYHLTSGYDGLYSIAQEHNVCVDDLYDANPILIDKSQSSFNAYGFRFRQGWLLFIPNVAPCRDSVLPETETISHIVRENETYERVAGLYNICLNRLLSANRHLHLDTLAKLEAIPYLRYRDWGTFDINTGLNMPILQPGMVVQIPVNRPPCYHEYGGPQRYICYEHPIDFTVDYSDHEPPIYPIERAEMDTASAENCYPLAYPATPIIYNNELIWRIYTRSMTVEQAANCFGTDLTEVHEANEWRNRPNGEYADLWQHIGVGYIVSNATATCGIEDLNDYINFDREDVVLTILPGTLEGRTFTIGEGDTLSGIARRTGYHPQQLKWNNPEIRDVNVVHTYQQIELPPYPSLYHLAGIGSGVLVLGVFRRYWLRRRHRGKKKRG
jgi:LysM repeat protein